MRFADQGVSQVVNERITKAKVASFNLVYLLLKRTGVNFDRVSRSRKLHHADDATAGNKSQDQSAAMPLKTAKREPCGSPHIGGTPSLPFLPIAFPAISNKIFFILLTETAVLHAVDSKRGNFSNFPRIVCSEFDTQSS